VIAWVAARHAIALERGKRKNKSLKAEKINILKTVIGIDDVSEIQVP
jgi:hypothetical protein